MLGGCLGFLPSTVGRTNPCWKSWFAASMLVSGVYTQHETREIPAFLNSHQSYQALNMAENQRISLGLWLTPIYNWSYIHSLKKKQLVPENGPFAQRKIIFYKHPFSGANWLFVSERVFSYLYLQSDGGLHLASKNSLPLLPGVMEIWHQAKKTLNAPL